MQQNATICQLPRKKTARTWLSSQILGENRPRQNVLDREERAGADLGICLQAKERGKETGARR